jgi:hypothetical protein
MNNRRDWPHDLKSLRTIAIEELLPEWNKEYRARSWPTHEWLNENGYSNLRWILENKHDGMNIKAFFTMIVTVDSDSSKWDTDDPETIKRAEEFIDRYTRFRNWRPGTQETIYYFLNRVFREHDCRYDDQRIIAKAKSTDKKKELFEELAEVVYQIKQDAASDDSAYQYLRAIQRFFESLDRRHILDDNPIEGLEKEFFWDFNSDGSEPLTPAQLGQLWEVADTLEEYLIIIGYCIWGLRRQELPTIDTSRLSTEDGDLYIEFREKDRKTGAATIEVIFGASYVEEQIDRQNSKSGWNGHLLPGDDPSEPMKPWQAADIFKDLCQRADVLVDGEPATPNNGRATWHDMHARAGAVLREIAEDYGSEQYDDSEAANRYQGVDTKEEMRQMLYLEKLKSVLPSEAYSEEFVFVEDVKNQTQLDGWGN